MLGVIQVQEAADCLGANCVPRYVEMKHIENLYVGTIFQQSKDILNLLAIHLGWLNKIEDWVRTKLWNESGKAWQSLLEELSDEASSSEVVVVVGHPAMHIVLMGQCLNVTKEWLGSFHLDAGSVCD